MDTDSRLLSVVAITGSSILVGCGGYSGSSCGSYGSYGSYGSFAAGSRRRSVHAARNANAATPAPGSGSYSACAPPGNGAAGIYEGTLTDESTQNVNPVVLIIAENGDGMMSGQDGAYYHLSLGTSGNDISGSFSAYSAGSSLPDGTRATSGSVSFTANAAGGLDGTLTGQSGYAAALSLNFDYSYELASALPTLAGSWNYSADGFSLSATILADGTFSAVDSNNCSYSGAFNLIDPNFNAYSESFSRSCNGINVTFAGLASYFPAAGSGTPPLIKLLADDNHGDYLVADLK